MQKSKCEILDFGLSFFILIFAFWFFPAPVPANPHLHPDIAAIEKTYQNTQTFQSEFTQSTFDTLTEKTITRHGRIFYENGGRLRIEYGGDSMTHYISDGNTLWVWDPKAKEILEFYPLGDSGIPAEALKILTDLSKLHRVFHVETKNEGLRLKPREKSSYRYLDCQFDDQNYLSKLTIRSLTGNTTTYRFFHVITSKASKPELFQRPR